MIPEGARHLIIDHLALRIHELEHLTSRRLLTAQPCLLGLEISQLALGGHGLPPQVAGPSILGHFHITTAGGLTSPTGSGARCPVAAAWLPAFRWCASLWEVAVGLRPGLGGWTTG